MRIVVRVMMEKACLESCIWCFICFVSLREFWRWK